MSNAVIKRSQQWAMLLCFTYKTNTTHVNHAQIQGLPHDVVNICLVFEYGEVHVH